LEPVTKNLEWSVPGGLDVHGPNLAFAHVACVAEGSSLEGISKAVCHAVWIEPVLRVQWKGILKRFDFRGRTWLSQPHRKTFREDSVRDHPAKRIRHLVVDDALVPADDEDPAAFLGQSVIGGVDDTPLNLVPKPRKARQHDGEVPTPTTARGIEESIDILQEQECRPEVV
jgi:hypothetical protein